MSRLPLTLRLARGLLAAAPVLALLQACGRSEPGDYLFGDDDGTGGRGLSGNVGTSGSGGVGVGGTRPGKGGAASVGGTAIGGGFTAGTTGSGGSKLPS